MNLSEIDIRRKAFRFAPPNDLHIDVKIEGAILRDAQILNLSTLGVALLLDRDPGEENLELSFAGRDYLAEIEIIGMIKHVHPAAAPDHEMFHVGIEFDFRSVEEQNKILKLVSSIAHEYKPDSRTSNISSNKRIAIGFPQSPEDYEEVFFLCKPLTIHHALFQTRYFTSKAYGTISFALPLIADTVLFGLPSDSLGIEFTNGLRKKGRTIAELGQPAFNNHSPYYSNPMTNAANKLQTLHLAFLKVLVYSLHLSQATDLIATVPSNLEEFYKLWLFQEMEREKCTMDSTVKQMHLDLKQFEEKLREERPQFAAQLENFMKEPNALSDMETKFFPDQSQLSEWFENKNPLLTNLTEDQTRYFAKLAQQAPTERN